ncbi:phytanoyl-CoA dioxygenase family protein [Marinivivus vitaminiproducens]|uniref:phytanoyl-CoA dioxygenase family protein n=1 Tax=Marinivivus vitaminiproducens TaxID=3035935 RepID=UPI0027AAE933|nr:phytanoyl-CoA dioxygenase family protein [Geminicoccaceae bacterium SCSIO 64248]
MAEAGFRFDGSDGSAEAYAPELYSPAAEATTLAHLDDVGPAELAFYEDHGWLLVRHVLEPGEIEEAVRGIDDLVAGRNRAFDGVYYENAARGQVEAAPSQRSTDHVRKLAWFVQHDARLNAIAEHPGILSVVSRLLKGVTPRLFQNMALLKPPSVGREKPWHQDHAYFNLPLATPVVGVWIALDEATVENGCMQVLDGGHKLGPVPHWKRRDWQICDTEILGRRSLACPLPAGGALFFDSLLPHGTPKNVSSARRRAVQFHYCPADAVKVGPEERLAVFGTEGKDVSC